MSPTVTWFTHGVLCVRSYESYGSTVTKALIEGGGDTKVTLKNAKRKWNLCGVYGVMRMCL